MISYLVAGVFLWYPTDAGHKKKKNRSTVTEDYFDDPFAEGRGDVGGLPNEGI